MISGAMEIHRPRLLETTRRRLRLKHYSLRKETLCARSICSKDVATTMIYIHVLSRGNKGML
jgi:hypothetical protein